jgi:hypothetical protein
MKKIFITLSILSLVTILYAKVFIFLPFGETQIKPKLNLFGSNEAESTVARKDPQNTEEKKDNAITKFSAYIQSGNWHLLKPYFAKGKYEKFMSNFLLDETVSKFKSAAANIPYVFVSNEGNVITMKHVRTGALKKISLNVTEGEPYEIRNYSISETNGIAQAMSISSEYNFVRLPNSAEDGPGYYVNYLEEFTKNKDVEVNTGGGIPFAQIDFEAIEFEYRKCILGVCRTKTFEYTLGKVISGRDVPGNANGFNKRYIGEVSDLTAFTTNLSANYLQFGNYTITAVIVDKEKKNILFLRDGLEPWIYGKKPGEVQFEKPIAAKVLNNILYVLDAARTGAKIYMLSINHNSNGDFSVNNLGLLNMGGIFPSYVNDIGGFEGTSSSVLLLGDEAGIHAIDVNNTTGQAIGTPRLYTSFVDPNDPTNIVDLNGVIRRLDGDQSAGSVVVLTYDNHIYSFNKQAATSSNTSSQISLSFLTRLSAAFYPTNLAYMRSEQKWYVTDHSGKMHTLSAEGRHIGSGGTHGKGEDGGELYFPAGITPNTISDPTNAYRYRFVVANEWGYETGFKLFAPDVYIPDLFVFENLNDSKLSFAFTTSGKWEFVELGKGITFSSIEVNGQAVSQSAWETQIAPGTVSNPGNQLTGFPNVIELNPSSIGGLKRGWNTVKINITIFRDNVGNKTVSKEIPFYWLPSSFTPSSDLSSGNFKLNQYNTIDDKKIDFIYKDILVGANGSFFTDNGDIYVSKGAELTLQSGATLFGNNGSANPLDNFRFAEGALINIDNGAYVCLNNSGSPDNYLNRSEYKEHIELEPNYVLGVNPPNLTEYAGSTCKSPCDYIDPSGASVSFTAEVDYATGPSFDVTVTPIATYCDRYQWKVDKVESNGSLTPVASQTFNGKPTAGKLNQLMSVSFSSCTEYNITLSIGCNQVTGFSTFSQRRISTSPRVDAGKDENICNSQSSYQLSGFTPATGVWSSSLINVSSGGSILTGSMSLDTPTELTLTVTDNFGCTSTDKKNVTLISAPSKPTLSTNSPACEKGKLILESTPVSGATYRWTGPNGFAKNTLEATFEVTVENTGYAGSYSVSAVANGCQSPASDPVAVTINPVTAVNAGSDISICANASSTTLTGASPANGTWSGNGVSSAGVFNPATAGTGTHVLTYSFTNTYNCLNSDTRTISVGPVISIGPDIEVCQNSGPINITGVTPAGGTFSGSGITNASGVFNPSSLTPGTYQVTYTLTQGGCTSTAIKNVIVKDIPSVPVISNNSPVCQGQNVLLDVTEISGATYLWTGPGGLTREMKSLSYPTGYSANEAGTFTVTATVNGCSQSATTEVVVKERPYVNLGQPMTLCENGSISMDAGNFYESYQWSKDGSPISGSTGQSLNIIAGGSYSVTVGNDIGCTSTASVKIDEQTKTVATLLDASGNLPYGFYGAENIDDIDGDGIKDLITYGNNGVGVWDVYVINLKADGTIKAQQKVIFPSGYNLRAPMFANYPDQDGDGRDEIVMSDYNEPTGVPGYGPNGAIYIVSLNTNATVKWINRIIGVEQLTTITIPQAFGISVEVIGDVDKNGIPDLAVGGLSSLVNGAVYVLLLNNDLSIKSVNEISSAAGTLSLQTSNSGAFGSDIVNIGDLDNDLIDEIAIGAPGEGQGKVIILYLNSVGLRKSEVYINYETDVDPNVLVRNQGFNDGFGGFIENIGDIDNNGVDDIVVSTNNRRDLSLIGGSWILSLNANGTIKNKSFKGNKEGIVRTYSFNKNTNRLYTVEMTYTPSTGNYGKIFVNLENICDNCSTPQTYYRDQDNDGYGNASAFVQSCTPRVGFVANDDDCDDTNAAVNPVAVEICDGIDNNCDGIIDFDFNVEEDATICQAATTGVQLSATGAVSYSWSPSTGLSNANIANPIALPSSTTTYTVSGTNGSGCILSKTVEITVAPNPLPPLISIYDGNSNLVTEVCEGSTVTMTLRNNGANAYVNLVSRPAFQVLGGTGFQGGYSQGGIVSESGYFIVRNITPEGCYTEASYHLTVNPKPVTVITVTPGYDLCSGTSFHADVDYGSQNTLISSSFLPYTNEVRTNRSGGFSFDAVIGNQSGYIVINSQTAKGCTATKSQYINVRQSPEKPVISADVTSLCPGGSNNITVDNLNNSMNYEYPNGSSVVTTTYPTGNSIKFNVLYGTSGGNVTAIATAFNGCEERSSVFIDIPASPVLSYTLNTNQCYGNPIYLDGSACTNETAYFIEIYKVSCPTCTTVVGSSYYYSWFSGEVGNVNLSSLYSFEPGAIYRVKLALSNGPCFWVEGVTVITVYPTAVSSFTLPSTVCSSQPVTFDGSASSNEVNHFIEIFKTNCSGCTSVTGSYYSSWISGRPGITNLRNLFSFSSGNYYKVKLAVSNNGCSWTETSKWVYIQGGCREDDGYLDNDYQTELIELYPNPVVDNFWVTLAVAEDAIIQVMDINGRTLKEVSCPAGRAKVDVHDLASGMYLVSIIQKDQVLRKKVEIRK